MSSAIAKHFVEPVAWRWRLGPGDEWTYRDGNIVPNDLIDQGWQCEPLWPDPPLARSENANVSVPRRFLVDFLNALDFHNGHGTPHFDRVQAIALSGEANALLKNAAPQGRDEPASSGRTGEHGQSGLPDGDAAERRVGIQSHVESAEVPAGAAPERFDTGEQVYRIGAPAVVERLEQPSRGDKPQHGGRPMTLREVMEAESPSRVTNDQSDAEQHTCAPDQYFDHSCKACAADQQHVAKYGDLYHYANLPTTDALPCPFCGGAPDVQQSTGTGLVAKCLSCLVDLPLSDWNTRTRSSTSFRIALPDQDRLHVMSVIAWLRGSEQGRLPDMKRGEAADSLETLLAVAAGTSSAISQHQEKP